MKGKKLVVTSAVLTAVLLSAAGALGIPPLVRAAEEAKRMSEAQAAQPELTRVAQAVNATEEAAQDKTRQIVQFANWVKVYQPTQEQQDEISRMIAAGANVEALLAVCQFWEDTNEPFSLVAELYAERPDDETLAKFQDHFLWITNAYDRLRGKEADELTREEIQAYQELGLSTADVLIADRMSRSGSDVREILSQKADGETWQQIILPDVIQSAAFHQQNSPEPVELDGNDLLDSLILSRRSGQPVETFLNLAQGESSVMDVYSEQQTQQTKEELAEIGLLQTDEEVQQ